jgi:DNA replication and repair protein RecF
MRLNRLHLEHFRSFEAAELGLGPGLNLFSGDNGAGKTSILEAVHLLAYGRSFRGAVRDGLIQRDSASLSVYAEITDRSGRSRRVGMERSLRDWRARVDGQPVNLLSDIYRCIAAVCFEPGSHELVSGSSELRRRFVDWGLFHVEPEFLFNWRRYQRSLKQRNSLLKSQSGDDALLEAWERELVESGEQLAEQRGQFLQKILPTMQQFAAALAPELGGLSIHYQRGWGAEAGDLAGVLKAQRQRDLMLGHTSSGPHRADWRSAFVEAPERSMLSRGQEKLTALIYVLAQAKLLSEAIGEWPVICLDDLASELDELHLSRALASLSGCDAQILLTALNSRPIDTEWSMPITRFHVEQGKTPLLL